MMPYDATRDALYKPYLRPTVFKAEQAPAYTVVQLGVEAARLAYLPAEREASWRQQLNEALQRVGFEALAVFADAPTGSQGFAALRPSDGLALVAFRGTEPQEHQDLLNDLDFLPTDWPEAAGRVHHGFAKATRSLLPQVQAWLAAHPHERLLVCGHSLGAAIATLASSVLKPTQLVTLGSPRVGDDTFAQCLQGVSTMRIVDGCDGVTEVPPSLPGARYVHIGPATFIDAEGHPHDNTDTSSEAISAQRRAMRLDYAEKYSLHAGNVRLRELADHAPINYVRAFIEA
jgi:hypothetical protein